MTFPSSRVASSFDRDVKHVSEELGRLAERGIGFFEPAGQRKQPMVWFDHLEAVR